MKKLILLNLVLLSFLAGMGQYNSRPSRSRFYNSKMSTFTLKAGDILLYTVNNDGDQYDVVVTVKKYGNTIGFDYTIPAKSQSGNVIIQASAVKSAVAYDTLLTGNSKNYKDTSILWLSQKNYTDLATAKETTMDVGHGSETFKRKGVSTLKLNYKGKEKIVTVFAITGTRENTKKEMWVLSEENNPLILKMEAGSTLTLKEVR